MDSVENNEQINGLDKLLEALYNRLPGFTIQYQKLPEMMGGGMDATLISPEKLVDKYSVFREEDGWSFVRHFNGM